jgi:hypothetical protein
MMNVRQGITIAIFVCHFLISSAVFDLPVYWPFLLAYFFFLVGITLKKQWNHQKKYGYSFFDFWKKGKM